MNKYFPLLWGGSSEKSLCVCRFAYGGQRSVEVENTSD